jgi:hypothetical protein
VGQGNTLHGGRHLHHSAHHDRQAFIKVLGKPYLDLKTPLGVASSGS